MPVSTLHTDTLATLLQVTKTLATEVHLERVLQVIVDKTTEVLDAERSSLFLYDRERDELWSIVAQGMTASKEIRFPADAGLAGYVARTRQPLRLDDAYADPRFQRVIDEETGFRTRSVLCWPVLDRSQQLIGVIEVLNKKHGPSFTEDDEALLEAFCAHAAVALERAMLVEAYVEQQRMQEAMKLAHEIQMGMLPTAFPRPPEETRFDLHACLAPALMVGGDLYDFFRLDDHRLGFALGDVSGKGVPAALFMVETHTLLRSLAPQTPSPDQCLQRLNQTQQGKPSLFVSLFYGVLDARTGRVDYCNAGHHPPILLRDGQAAFLPKAQNLPLSRIKAFSYRAGRLMLAPGDVLLLYTDGVVEATAPDGSAFGARRLLQTLQQHPKRAPDQIIRDLSSALHTFTGNTVPHDDVTLMALRYLGNP